MTSRLTHALVLSGALSVLVACTAGDPPVPDNPGGAIIEPAPDDDGFAGLGVPEPYPMPSVSLTDTSGESFDLVDDTAQPVTLVFFGYTHCPDVCSLVMADVASAMTRLDEGTRDEVQMLFITTDPARDDEAVIRDYLDRFDPDFEGLTGPLPRIKAAAQPLGVLIEGTNRLPSGGYEVGHGSQVLGFGPDDTAQVVWTEGTPVADLVTDIEALAEGA
ncbi:MAG: SCO family protein [Actinomycetota bacterium]|nr:SCO family protein [Actinomycetota bacterium]MDQ3422114.1 SCO family protein [Actinomycetota bacterium]